MSEIEVNTEVETDEFSHEALDTVEARLPLYSCAVVFPVVPAKLP